GRRGAGGLRGGGGRGQGPPAPTQACQTAGAWQNNVVQTPDPTKNGAPATGFTGRLYLFGPTIDYPLVGEGSLTVDLIDETYEPAVTRERWNIDPETLKRLARKDMIGWGYTLFLPSREYNKEMSKVRLRTSFTQGKAAPLYTENVVT